MKNILIIHGYDAHNKKHWFPYLENELQEANVKTLSLPNASSPLLKEWLDCIDTEVKKVGKNENLFFVAHSLGCIALMQYLNSLDSGFKIGGFVLVSGFYEKLENLSLLDEFTNIKLNEQKIIDSSLNRFVFAARDDYIVESNKSQNLAKLLKATYIEFEKGGHFMQDDGFKEFRALKILLKQII